MHKSFFIFGTLVALLISLSQAQNGDGGDGDPPVNPDNFKFADLGDEFAFLDGDDLQLNGGDDLNSDGGDGWKIDMGNNDGDQSDNGGVRQPGGGYQSGGSYQSGGNWRGGNRGQQAGGGYIRPAPGNRPGGGSWKGNQADDFQTGGGSRYQPGSYYVGRQDDGYRSGGNWQGNQDNNWKSGGNWQGNQDNYYGGSWPGGSNSRRSNQGGYYKPQGGSRDDGSVLKDVHDAIWNGFNKIQDGIHHALKGKFF